jgi:hypothetical protein
MIKILSNRILNNHKVINMKKKHKKLRLEDERDDQTKILLHCINNSSVILKMKNKIFKASRINRVLIDNTMIFKEMDRIIVLYCQIYKAFKQIKIKQSTLIHYLKYKHKTYKTK